MAEETKGADFNSAFAIVLVIFFAAIVGGCYIIALLFSIQVRNKCSYHA